MGNDIGGPLKLYKDKIIPFEDTSGAAAVVYRKVDREASDDLSRDSKEYKLVIIN